MSTYYSQASGAWSLMSNWNTAANGSGSTPANLAAFDNNSVVIQAPHAIMCDVDTSGFSNGLTGLTINGGATPGMLYANTGGNGYILLKAGAVLAGTTSTNRGRLLANSDGVWGHTTPLPFGYKFYINELTTAKIDTSNLDSSIWDTEPGITQIATYKTNNTVTASSATSQFTLGVTLASLGWANNTPIM